MFEHPYCENVPRPLWCPRLGLTAVASQYGCAEALGRGCEGPHAAGQDVLGAHEGGEYLVMQSLSPFPETLPFLSNRATLAWEAWPAVFGDEVMVKERAMGTGLGLPGQTREGGAGAHVGLVIPGESAFLKEKESGK